MLHSTILVNHVVLHFCTHCISTISNVTNLDCYRIGYLYACSFDVYKAKATKGSANAAKTKCRASMSSCCS